MVLETALGTLEGPRSIRNPSSQILAVAVHGIIKAVKAERVQEYARPPTAAFVRGIRGQTYEKPGLDLPSSEGEGLSGG